jgi:hypothetical protein
MENFDNSRGQPDGEAVTPLQTFMVSLQIGGFKIHQRQTPSHPFPKKHRRHIGLTECAVLWIFSER